MKTYEQRTSDVLNKITVQKKQRRFRAGVAVVSLKKKASITYAVAADASGVTNQSRYRTRTLPSAGALLKEEDSPEKQIQFEV